MTKPRKGESIEAFRERTKLYQRERRARLKEEEKLKQAKAKKSEKNRRQYLARKARKMNNDKTPQNPGRPGTSVLRDIGNSHPGTPQVGTAIPSRAAKGTPKGEMSDAQLPTFELDFHTKRLEAAEGRMARLLDPDLKIDAKTREQGLKEAMAVHSESRKAILALIAEKKQRRKPNFEDSHEIPPVDSHPNIGSPVIVDEDERKMPAKTNNGDIFDGAIDVPSDNQNQVA